MTEFIYQLLDIEKIAKAVLSKNIQKVIVFNGEMGAGKTTFIKALCKALGVENETSSPTFSIVNEYKTNKNETIYHFDVYRLKNEIEALDMGIEEYLYSGNYCFVEWAEKIPNLLPQNHAVINIDVIDNNFRKLTLS
jgi:tRNA threonylcarbamoyladenosine biosynthesis protein TsaE